MSELSNHKAQTPEAKSENWFETWFNSPYYHILYKERNDQEAQLFMDNLTHYLNLPEEAKILDLACGKGRHSIYLNQLGYDVTGVDLAENSIAEAAQFSNEKLQFKVHDMRERTEEKYDAVFNLFTSFGYFENESDNLKTLIAIKESLTEYGFAVIDFLNVNYVINNLVPEEIKTVDGIDFYIKRDLREGHIFKQINFEYKGKKYHFTEKVRALTLQDFETMMEEAGIYLLEIFGDYKLRKFYKNESERLIMIFK
ncbi:methyltransferase domain-containing protein [Flavobacterium columnare]|uniref:class I SAM-dependent methyltransferase n=1 Tax=Flavobacterium columnare TaxID=996 RepID=UPI00177DBE90|nr:class I SAM-dependent methyltransferase [Flavobacterium columnare]QOG90448.1 methyltransferase domain-containing protein [Flavobacterium columnare]QOG93104.1 methyltransferase domain-containing protein [Flavobacterium columnare]QOG95769.1 methyltransferase domain-containing protein [Flavobacterium columnare]QOG98429.1 methyltransferase domain-containing protein [Flavobacterium columnare]QOH01088.1 methyltransferase domain-containing protein [Flavobacterium columnare]